MPKRSIDEEASTAHNKQQKNHDFKTTDTQPGVLFSSTPSIKFSRYRSSQPTSNRAEDVVPIPTFSTSFNAVHNARSPTGSTASGRGSSNNKNASAHSSNTTVTPPPQTQVAIKREASVATPTSTSTKRKIAGKEELSKLLLEKLQSNHGNIVANVLEELAIKLKECPPVDLLEHFFLLGGHTLLALTLTKWKEDQAIQAMGCRCIMRLISCSHDAHNNGDDGSQKGGLASKSVDLLLIVGTLDLATHALKTFPRSATVQFYGLAAIGNLLNPKKEIATHRVAAKRFVEELDGIATIAKAMTAFPKREQLQEIALWVLKLLSELGMSRSALKANATLLVATAAQNFPNNEEILGYTRAFMKDAFDIE